MPHDAQAFWVVEPGRGEIRAERLAEPGPDDVVVETIASGVSRGTESLVFEGHVPASEWTRMRAPFQAGDFPGPVKYGYAAVGRVVEGPASLTGATVFVLHPHQTRFVVPASAVHVVPDVVPPARAILAANMETAINGIWDARPHVGDRISVVGAGTVGCLTAWLAARVAGCDVELVDVNPSRAAVAARLGVTFADPTSARLDRDVVLHASGHDSGLRLALQLAAFEARIVELSWYGDREATVPLGQAFHARRLHLVSSQVGHIPEAQRSRWTHRRRLQFALSRLADPALDAVITGESAFVDLPDVMARLSRAPGHEICHRVRY
jgi:2-desacetyl-2-hydroxyethyl bacteriochlorophyllide A dehydrogenase